jgi:hypothetical protein
MKNQRLKVGMFVGYLKSWGKRPDRHGKNGKVVSTTTTTATLDNGDVISQQEIAGFNVLASMADELKRTEPGFDLDHLIPTAPEQPCPRCKVTVRPVIRPTGVDSNYQFQCPACAYWIPKYLEGATDSEIAANELEYLAWAKEN